MSDYRQVSRPVTPFSCALSLVGVGCLKRQTTRPEQVLIAEK